MSWIEKRRKAKYNRQYYRKHGVEVRRRSKKYYQEHKEGKKNA